MSAPSLVELREILRPADFRRLFAVRLLGQAADGAFQVALASFVFFSPERQTTAGRAAAAFAVLLLPYSLVGPFAGVFLDRWSRQRVLVVANLVRTGGVAWVAALVAVGVAGPLFFASALAVLSVNRFILAALSAALPHVVRPDRLVLANSVTTTTGTLVAVVGGGLAYLIDVLAPASDVGAGLVTLVGSIGYLGAGLVAAGLGRDLLGPDPDPDRPQTREALRRVYAGVIDGARHVWGHRPAGHALAAIAAHRFFYGVSFVATLLLYRNYFYAPEQTQASLGGLGLIATVSTVGVVIGAVITPRATRWVSKVRWVACLYAGAAVVEVVLGFPYTEPAFLLAALLLGVVAQGSKICVDTIVQESVDDAFRGRVFSFYDILFNVSFVAAAAFGAVTLPANGKSYAVLGFIAVGYAVTAVSYAVVSRRYAAQLASAPAEVSATAPQAEAAVGDQEARSGGFPP